MSEKKEHFDPENINNLNKKIIVVGKKKKKKKKKKNKRQTTPYQVPLEYKNKALAFIKETVFIEIGNLKANKTLKDGVKNEALVYSRKIKKINKLDENTKGAIVNFYTIINQVIGKKNTNLAGIIKEIEDEIETIKLEYKDLRGYEKIKGKAHQDFSRIKDMNLSKKNILEVVGRKFEMQAICKNLKGVFIEKNGKF